MGVYTNLYCHLVVCKQTLNTKNDVLDAIKEIEEDLNHYKEDLRGLVMITDPSKMFVCTGGEQPFDIVKRKAREDMTAIKDCFYRLWVYNYIYRCWDQCHDENGVANGMPDEYADENIAFIDGDFVK